MSAKALLVLGLTLLGAGLLVGFIPVSSQGVNCGSAFAESRDARVADMTQAMFGRDSDTAAGCTDLRNIIRIPALVLFAGGAVALVGAGVVNNRTRAVD